ncbi:MAG: hypothetical protein M3R48_10145 [Candidatus Dormibacteraeota bacterium]|nr:hypothetical protein [Candidatus Dormibacteraeota bacterium]
MLRVVRAAAIGWACGFGVAVAWSAVSGGDRQLGSALLFDGIGGLLVMAAVLAVAAVRTAVVHRRSVREAERDAAWFARILPAGTDGAGTAVATATAELGVARIALLEARLADEQASLDAAMRAMAEQDAAVEVTGRRLMAEAPAENPAVTEPVLRQELVTALVELMGRPTAGSQLAQSTGSLLDRAGSSAPRRVPVTFP